MTEIVVSPAAQLAWQIAGDLALQNGDPFIEPKHLLFGLCSVEKVLVSGDKTKLTAFEESEIRTESAQLRSLSQRHSFSLSAVRKAIRESSSHKLGRVAEPALPGRVVSRSPAARRVFEKAAEMSGARGVPKVDLLLLLRAVLESGDAQLSGETACYSTSLNGVLRELREGASEPVAQGLTDLDQQSDAVLPVEVTESVDATVSISPKAAVANQRLTWLSEFTWEFGTEGEQELLLQEATERLLRLVPTAERGAILIRDARDNELLLKAHSPRDTTPRISMTSVRKAMEEKKGCVWKRGQDLTLSQKQSNTETGMYAPLVVNGQSIGAICLDSTVPSMCFTSEDLEIVTFFAHQLALAVANHELRLTLKQNNDVLERLLTNFSPQVRSRLMQRARMGRLALGGEHSVVTILCSDIRGFTLLSARMCPDEVVDMLNEYFGALVDCIFRHDGTVDKFVGDSILAVFGSPEADPQHHRKAVLAAVEMQQVMQQVSGNRAAKGRVTCQIGIGVHTGDVLHGFIGSPERMEFTIIGEAVNLAARYSDGAKGEEILISPEVHQRVWQMIDAEQVSIPTKHEGAFTAYRVKGLCGRATIPSS